MTLRDPYVKQYLAKNTITNAAQPDCGACGGNFTSSNEPECAPVLGTKFHVALSPSTTGSGEAVLDERKTRKYNSLSAGRQRASRNLTDNKYTKKCGLDLVSSSEKTGKSGVVGIERSASGHTRVAGHFRHCGRTFCYECGQYRRLQASAKLAEALRNWVDPALGRHAIFFSFTTPHRWRDNLKTLIEIVDDGVRHAFRQNTGYRSKKFREQWNIQGKVVADDWTYGAAHGHHPHVAGICFVDWSGVDDVGAHLLRFREALLSRYTARVGDRLSAAGLGGRVVYQVPVDGYPALFESRHFAEKACQDQGLGFDNIAEKQTGTRLVYGRSQYVDIPYGRWVVGKEVFDDVREALKTAEREGACLTWTKPWAKDGRTDLEQLARYLCKASTEVEAPKTGAGGLSPVEILDVYAMQLDDPSRASAISSDPIKATHGAYGIWQAYQEAYARRNLLRTSKRFWEKFGVSRRVHCTGCNGAGVVVDSKFMGRHWGTKEENSALKAFYSQKERHEDPAWVRIWPPKECKKCNGKGWLPPETIRPMCELVADVQEPAERKVVDWSDSSIVLTMLPSVHKGFADGALLSWLLWYTIKDRPGIEALRGAINELDQYTIHRFHYIKGHPQWERYMIWAVVERWALEGGHDNPRKWSAQEETDWDPVEGARECQYVPHVSTWVRDDSLLMVDLPVYEPIELDEADIPW